MYFFRFSYHKNIRTCVYLEKHQINLELHLNEVKTGEWKQKQKLGC